MKIMKILERDERTDEPYFRYGSEPDVRQITFVNPGKGIEREIVSAKGRIVDFPGYAHPEFVRSVTHSRQDFPYAFHGVWFYADEERPGRYHLVWRVQEDGWADMDDTGFGAGDRAEIKLYATLDDEGQFAEPFRIFNIGSNNYFQSEREDVENEEYLRRVSEEEEMKAKGMSKMDIVRERLRGAVERMVEKLPEPTEDEVFSLPGDSIHAGNVRCIKRGGSYYIGAGARVPGTQVYALMEGGLSAEEAKEWLLSDKHMTRMSEIVIREAKELDD